MLVLVLLRLFDWPCADLNLAMYLFSQLAEVVLRKEGQQGVLVAHICFIMFFEIRVVDAARENPGQSKLVLLL